MIEKTVLLIKGCHLLTPNRRCWWRSVFNFLEELSALILGVDSSAGFLVWNPCDLVYPMPDRPRVSHLDFHVTSAIIHSMLNSFNSIDITFFGSPKIVWTIFNGSKFDNFRVFPFCPRGSATSALCPSPLGRFRSLTRCVFLSPHYNGGLCVVMSAPGSRSWKFSGVKVCIISKIFWNCAYLWMMLYLYASPHRGVFSNHDLSVACLSPLCVQPHPPLRDTFFCNPGGVTQAWKALMVHNFINCEYLLSCKIMHGIVRASIFGTQGCVIAST